MEMNSSSPKTAVACARPMRLPLPNSPLSFPPQQYAAPAAVSAQEWPAPAVTDSNVTVPDCTSTGVALLFNV